MYSKQQVLRGFNFVLCAIAIINGSINAALASGEAVYSKTCAACHATGVAGAPALGNKAAWKARIALGSDTLVKHAISGIRAMPPKGGCTSCTDDDIKAAVAYMVKKSS